jgi:hypothetical protein
MHEALVFHYTFACDSPKARTFAFIITHTGRMPQTALLCLLVAASLLPATLAHVPFYEPELLAGTPQGDWSLQAPFEIQLSAADGETQHVCCIAPSLQASIFSPAPILASPPAAMQAGRPRCRRPRRCTPCWASPPGTPTTPQHSPSPRMPRRPSSSSGWRLWFPRAQPMRHFFQPWRC